MKKKIIGTIASLVMILNVVLFSFNYEVNASEALYGDVNGDGKVNIMDILTLQKNLKNWKVEIRDDLSDIYKDGKIDEKDKEVLLKYIAGFTEYRNLPYVPLYGDINGDSKIDVDDIVLLQKYVANWDVTIKEDLADVYEDGKIDEKDLAVLQHHLAGWKKYQELPYKPLYGDVNGDGKVDIDDILLLEKGLEGWKVTIDRDLADVYKDGKINNRDLTVLKRHIAGEKMFEQLPYERK